MHHNIVQNLTISKQKNDDMTDHETILTLPEYIAKGLTNRDIVLKKIQTEQQNYNEMPVEHMSVQTVMRNEPQKQSRFEDFDLNEQRLTNNQDLLFELIKGRYDDISPPTSPTLSNIETRPVDLSTEPLETHQPLPLHPPQNKPPQPQIHQQKQSVSYYKPEVPRLGNNQTLPLLPAYPSPQTFQLSQPHEHQQQQTKISGYKPYPKEVPWSRHHRHNQKQQTKISWQPQIAQSNKQHITFQRYQEQKRQQIESQRRQQMEIKCWQEMESQQRLQIELQMRQEKEQGRMAGQQQLKQNQLSEIIRQQPSQIIGLQPPVVITQTQPESIRQQQLELIIQQQSEIIRQQRAAIVIQQQEDIIRQQQLAIIRQSEIFKLQQPEMKNQQHLLGYSQNQFNNQYISNTYPNGPTRMTQEQQQHPSHFQYYGYQNR